MAPRTTNEPHAVRVGVGPAWAEAVFHVLAHVDGGALAASCYEPVYIAWAARFLGDSRQRTLAGDATILAAVAPTHDALARIQALAWVFTDAASVASAHTRDLAELADTDVADASALAAARAAGDAAEILRAAAELELPLLAGLPSVDLDDGVEDAVLRIAPAAPALVGCSLARVRPLGMRGRVFGASILAGVPGMACPDADHAAWQMAHEATVREVQLGMPCGSFVEVERRAIARLRARAAAAGLAEGHAHWLARLDFSQLGSTHLEG